MVLALEMHGDDLFAGGSRKLIVDFGAWFRADFEVKKAVSMSMDRIDAHSWLACIHRHIGVDHDG